MNKGVFGLGFAAGAALVGLVACSGGADHRCVGGATYIAGAGCAYTPQEAVMRAADAAPGGVDGVFVLEVRATGRQGEWLYLNSETDYRDQRNLSVAVGPELAADLTRRFGQDAGGFLKGRRVAILGAARRVRIELTDPNGSPTGKYYYQTHVRLQGADRLTVLAD